MVLHIGRNKDISNYSMNRFELFKFKVNEEKRLGSNYKKLP